MLYQNEIRGFISYFSCCTVFNKMTIKCFALKKNSNSNNFRLTLTNKALGVLAAALVEFVSSVSSPIPLVDDITDMWLL